MQAEKLQEIDGQLINQETGEIVDITEYYGPEGVKAKTEDLPKLARAIRFLRSTMQSIEQYKQQELQRIADICDFKLNKIIEQENYLVNLCKELFDSTGEKKIDYPGLGKFTYQKGREYVNIEPYCQLDDETKIELQSNRPNLLRSITKVEPDKKAIREMAIEELPDCFVITRNPDKFIFKEE